MYRGKGEGGPFFERERRVVRALDADDLAGARAALNDIASSATGAAAERAAHALQVIAAVEAGAPVRALVELRHGASSRDVFIDMALHRAIARALERDGDMKLAAFSYSAGARYDDYKRLAEADGQDPHLYDIDAPEKLLERLDGLVATDPAGRARRARALAAARRGDEAVAEAEAALAGDPDVPLVYLALAEALLACERPGDATEALERGAARLPSDEGLLLYLAHHYEWTIHDDARALAVLERVVSANPSESGAWGDLVYGLCLARRTPEARRWIERLRSHAAPGSSYRTELDNYAAKMDEPDFDRDLAEIRALKRARPGHPSRWLWLAAGAALVGVLGWLASLWL